MVQPIGDHILVKPVAIDQTTKSGIVLPDTSKEKPQTGQVIAIGHGKYHGETLVSFESMGVTKGATVMFTKYGPTEIKIDGEDYYILESHDILGIIS
jgi:chaperonin GroES